MLRDVLTELPGVGTWPCDEINLIWRYGNASAPTDELDPTSLTPKIKRYIRRSFDKQAKKQHLDVVVEKTCANSLRIPYVSAIFPEASYIYIIRDGRDVVASALKRWRSRPDFTYLAKKAQYVPLRDSLYYGGLFLYNRTHQMITRDNRQRSWGPRFHGLDEFVKTEALELVCAYQWARCVQASDAALASMDRERILFLRYEDLVAEPRATLAAIRKFPPLHTIDDDLIHAAPSSIRTESAGAWRRALSNDALDRIMPIIQPSLLRHGYEP